MSPVRRIFAALLMQAGTFSICALHGQLPPPPAKLDATLRQLEKDIAAVRGLEFKAPVSAKVIPRPKDAAKKVQGYYSTKDKTLFVYDDVTGAYERGVPIHEMVHALQDQHFGLAKLHQSTFGSEAELALAALVEGDATFTMIELLKKDQPKVAAMLDVPLEKAKDLQNAFLYAQGARYVKAMKERGGWAAVNFAYKFPPRTTAAILHPEGVKTVNLGPGASKGELAIIKILASHPETAPVSVKSASGWKGDRTIKLNGGEGWVVAFSTPAQALQFQKAMTELRLAQFPPQKSFVDQPGARAWDTAKGEVHAVLARHDRVLVIEAPDRKTYQGLLDRLEGPPSLTVYAAKDKQLISFGQLIDRLQGADLICIGESHDHELDHRVQLQVLKALFAQDERLGLGMEMFQRPFQKEIDLYIQGKTDEAQFLAATEYHKRWGFDWGLYRPLVEFCRKNGVPLAALNAPKELTARVSKVGYAGLTEDEKQQLGPIDFQVKAHRDHWYETLGKLHGSTKSPPEQKERSYQVMTVWDGYMAASAAQFQTARGLKRMVVLAGSGHIDHGFGIPDRAAKITGGKAVTLHIEAGPAPATVNAIADHMLYVE